MKKLILLLMLFVCSSLFAQKSYVNGNTVTVNTYFGGTGYPIGITVSGQADLKSNLRIENKCSDTLYVAFAKSDGVTPDTTLANCIPILPGEEYPFPSVPSSKFYLKGKAAGTAKYWVNYGAQIYKPEGRDFKSTVENSFTATQTFEDSTVFKNDIWQIGTITNKPITYHMYTDAAGFPVTFEGQVGVREWNAGFNLLYKQGLHHYFDTNFAASYITLVTTDSSFLWQWMPKGWGNSAEQPDAWNRSGGITPFKINSQGFIGFIGGVTSIFKYRGAATIGANPISDYIDTNQYNFYGRNGKSAFDWKVGIGTFFPATTLHQINKANVPATSNYNALSDHIIQDDGASDRAQTEYRSPNGSLIAFGNQTTYNLAYLQFVNSTSTFNLVSSIINLAGTVQENGTALTGKYSQLGASNTFTGTTSTFTNKVVVGTGTSNGTSDLLVMGDTTTIRGTLYRDSSYWRAEINPFSQRLKISAIGKLGNNMFTIDSTLITSALAMTITGDFTTGGNLFAGSNSKYIGWSTRSVMQSSINGVVDFFFNDGTTRAKLIAGTIDLRTIATYADNTAALSGGLTAGVLYKTATGELRITY